MGDLFLQRLKRHQKRMLKYLRYVLNDHFVLVLLFLLGAVSVYYARVLNMLPHESWVSLLTGVLWLALLHFGQHATLTEKADTIFLLPKERGMKSYFIRSLFYSCLLPFILLAFVGGMTMPLIAVGVGQNLSSFIFYLPSLWALKFSHLISQYYRLFQHEQRTNQHAYTIWLGFSALSLGSGILVAPWLSLVVALGGIALFWRLYFQHNGEALDWEKMVDLENNRLHRIYQFINLFTDVPEITSTVKRRKYLDPLLQQIKKTHNNTYTYLYARRVLRGSEFSGLYFRLVAIGGFLVFFLEDFWFSLGISALFLYLIGFQLIPLYGQFKYMVLTHLYPIPSSQKLSAMEKVLGVLLLVAALIFGGIGFFRLPILMDRFLLILVLVAEVGIFTKIYLPYRIKKMEDD